MTNKNSAVRSSVSIERWGGSSLSIKGQLYKTMLPASSTRVSPTESRPSSRFVTPRLSLVLLQFPFLNYSVKGFNCNRWLSFRHRGCWRVDRNGQWASFTKAGLLCPRETMTHRNECENFGGGWGVELYIIILKDSNPLWITKWGKIYMWAFRENPVYNFILKF